METFSVHISHDVVVVVRHIFVGVPKETPDDVLLIFYRIDVGGKRRLEAKMPLYVVVAAVVGNSIAMIWVMRVCQMFDRFDRRGSSWEILP